MSIKPFPETENIQAIPIPLPVETQLITVNLYYVGKGPITLIDTGPKFPGLLAFVGEQLRTAGFGFEDIERIIATHGHVDNVSFLKDGDAFSGNGYRLKVIHTPGHTAGSVCVYEPEQRILFSGDNMIKHITPNPLVDIRKYGHQNSDYQSLPTFLESLDNISKLDVRYVFTGHGEYMEDMHQIISTYKAHHRQRMDLIWKALKKSSRPIYQLIDDVFPVVPEGDIFLAVSEIAVHLEVLINEGRAELLKPGPPALFRAL